MIGSRAGGWTGWPGMPWTYLAMLPCIGRRGWPYWGSPITSYTAGARFDMASLINTAQSHSVPPPHQPVHSPTHHQIHSIRSIGAAHSARKPRRGISAGVPKSGDPPPP